MTTGVVVTITTAIIVYLLLSYFVFNREDAVVTTPTPRPTRTGVGYDSNELSVIFSNVGKATLTVNFNKNETITAFQSLITGQTLGKKELQIVSFLKLDNKEVQR